MDPPGQTASVGTNTPHGGTWAARDVVLIVLDIRKDSFDANVPKLAEPAKALFDRCYAASSWSLPIHASMLFGELPHREDVHSYNPDFGAIRETFLAHFKHHRIAVNANGVVSDAKMSAAPKIRHTSDLAQETERELNHPGCKV